VVLGGSIWASSRAAERESLNDARTATKLLATILIEPALDDAVLTGDRDALDRLDAAVQRAKRDTDLERVKIWAPDNRIVYSDERRLLGSRDYELGDEERKALASGDMVAEVSDLEEPENEFERGLDRELLEVYGRVNTTPSGQPLLLETYSGFDDVTSRQVDVWLMFAPISAIALLLLLAMQLPIGDRMVRQLRAGEEERIRLLSRAADASSDERRRIAGSLHDGIVQDLAAASFLLSGTTDRLAGSADRTAQDAVPSLRAAGGAVRNSVTALRSLLIEIYPPHLAQAGLSSALRNLAVRLQPRDVEVAIDVPDELDPPPDVAALLFRVAQEALLNVTKHAQARTVRLTVREEDSAVTLEVTDDGIGFDPTTVTATDDGHFGLAVLSDLAEAAGATLDIATAPQTGTALRLRVPLQ